SAPCRSQARTACAQAPSWAGVRAVQSQPPRTNWASIPCAAQKRSISPIPSAERRQSESASSAPTTFASDGNFAHQESAKPPLRPEAPPPQTSRSTTTTSQLGSHSFSQIAVHKPTKPPPITQTSLRVLP